MTESGSDCIGRPRWRCILRADPGHPVEDRVVFELTNEHDAVLASFSIELEHLAALLKPHIALYLDLGLIGAVNANWELAPANAAATQNFDILELTRACVDPANLEDESEAAQQLQQLKEKLKTSLQLIETTLLNLPSNDRT